MKKTIEQTIAEHLKADEAFQEKMNRVLFGDPSTGDIGMVKENKEMYALLMATKNVGGFFGGVKGFLGWILFLGAVVVTVKGWWAGLLTHLLQIR